MSALDGATLGVLILVFAIQIYVGVLRLLATANAAIVEVADPEPGAYPPSIHARHFLTRWLCGSQAREGPASTGKKIPGAYYLYVRRTIHPERFFHLNPIDRKLVPAICHQFSFFALAAMAIVRFAYGEPILRFV